MVKYVFSFIHSMHGNRAKKFKNPIWTAVFSVIPCSALQPHLQCIFFATRGWLERVLGDEVVMHFHVITAWMLVAILNYFPLLWLQLPWQVCKRDWSLFSNPLIVHSQILGRANSHACCWRKKSQVLKIW